MEDGGWRMEDGGWRMAEPVGDVASGIRRRDKSKTLAKIQSSGYSNKIKAEVSLSTTEIAYKELQVWRAFSHAVVLQPPGWWSSVDKFYSRAASAKIRG